MPDRWFLAIRCVRVHDLHATKLVVAEYGVAPLEDMYKVEIRGTRTMEVILFRVKDVGAVFESPPLAVGQWPSGRKDFGMDFVILHSAHIPFQEHSQKSDIAIEERDLMTAAGKDSCPTYRKSFCSYAMLSSSSLLQRQMAEVIGRRVYKTRSRICLPLLFLSSRFNLASDARVLSSQS
ncbi:hypothetical protein DVH05_008677 [Phytophthora capsici]|nr:hypothetical protein DVH05_008677 [Phytophthora capsici]